MFILHADHGVPQWRGKGDLVMFFNEQKFENTFTFLAHQVRVRVWFNYYTFLGEMEFQASVQPMLHSHIYEGKDWQITAPDSRQPAFVALISCGLFVGLCYTLHSQVCWVFSQERKGKVT